MKDGPRLARRVAGSAVVNIWLTLLGLFTTPYILLGLGSGAYGVFAMVSVVSVHLSNLELGFGQATVHYLARARAAGDVKGELVILEASCAIFLAGGLTGAVLLFAGAPYLGSSFFFSSVLQAFGRARGQALHHIYALEGTDISPGMSRFGALSPGFSTEA